MAARKPEAEQIAGANRCQFLSFLCRFGTWLAAFWRVSQARHLWLSSPRYSPIPPSRCCVLISLASATGCSCVSASRQTSWRSNSPTARQCCSTCSSSRECFPTQSQTGHLSRCRNRQDEKRDEEYIRDSQSSSFRGLRRQPRCAASAVFPRLTPVQIAIGSPT